eukprot:CAMPEP_0118926174 /NCGR_PEP_ID=MMETSP1169-20130426/3934_1 /TAXON_ID=36882 /ORGANISM="Pyramimonas obovata, Strain CCMP722" /LENGTH=562 /DNA_ID=CAMNT_0006867675 /DNA_START=59 /DNA_END=1747 /DNA_ORIENTATION=-
MSVSSQTQSYIYTRKGSVKQITESSLYHTTRLAYRTSRWQTQGTALFYPVPSQARSAKDVSEILSVGRLSGVSSRKRLLLARKPWDSIHESRSTTVCTASVGVDNDKVAKEHNVVNVIRFALPVLGVYICSPLMSLVDTAFVGATSSVELAALSPGTILCDMSLFLFTFLTAATTGLVARAMAKAPSRESKAEAVNTVHVCIFTGLACGLLLTGILEFWNLPLLKLLGLKDTAVLNAAATYVRIRGYAMPFQLVAMVCNSVSIGVRDTWTPLRITVLSSVLNLLGDFVLCSKSELGIVGAAWATTASLWVYQALQVMAVQRKDLLPPLGTLFTLPHQSQIAPLLSYVGPLSFVVFTRVLGFSLMSASASALGTAALGAHQIAFSLFMFFAVFGECLSQTAQTLIPSLVIARSTLQARKLVNLLCKMGIALGATIGAFSSALLIGAPTIFTTDKMIISELAGASMPLFLALTVTSVNIAMDGVMVAQRSFKYIVFTTTVTLSVQVGFLYLGNHYFTLGILGIWGAMLARLIVYAGIIMVKLTSDSLLGPTTSWHSTEEVTRGR